MSEIDKKSLYKYYTREKMEEDLALHDVDSLTSEDIYNIALIGCRGYKSLEDKELIEMYQNIIEDSYCDDCTLYSTCVLNAETAKDRGCWVRSE